MNILITNLIGVILTFMIFFNAKITENLGMFLGLVVIHVVGLIGSVVLLKTTKNKITYDKTIHFIFYLGGVLGVFTVLSNSYSFLAIGASLSTTVALLGQTVASVFVDVYGIGGAPKRTFNKKKLLGLFIIFLGIVVMGVSR